MSEDNVRPEGEEVLSEHGEELVALVRAVRTRLGMDWLTDVSLEVTPKGRAVLHANGHKFFHDDDAVIVCKPRAGSIQYGTVLESGGVDWQHLVGIGGDPEMN